ncbi:hypothetical protein EJ06DRAFT_186712 [Trichodelitschia bisporula]|uniref:Uncharacterized protein n=1 Tax=Trichodelitschia bisporula TaxID=703511 RepID=A0A6G1I6Y9_9PEZI|nr:hypothetical protein EJ06DRAFT_186712 [Trichodelitschia bisporula]
MSSNPDAGPACRTRSRVAPEDGCFCISDARFTALRVIAARLLCHEPKTDDPRPGATWDELLADHPWIWLVFKAPEVTQGFINNGLGEFLFDRIKVGIIDDMDISHALQGLLMIMFLAGLKTTTGLRKRFNEILTVAPNPSAVRLLRMLDEYQEEGTSGTTRRPKCVAYIPPFVIAPPLRSVASISTTRTTLGGEG